MAYCLQETGGMVKRTVQAKRRLFIVARQRGLHALLAEAPSAALLPRWKVSRGHQEHVGGIAQSRRQALGRNDVMKR